MARAKPPAGHLLRWSDYTPTSDVQDPLGLNLRGSTRLASRLLFCITSVTPRARYFSFLPWCIQDFRRNEQDKPSALGLREAIRLREHALALGCVAHHGGRTCDGGGLVGSDKAIAWLGRGGGGAADLARILAREPFTKYPALDAYFNSLANLGLFVTDEELPDDLDGEEPTERTFDDVHLAPLGEELASLYGSSVTGLAAVPALSTAGRSAALDDLASLGEHGGLCELALGDAPDRGMLRDLFFRRRPLRARAHRDRRMSLLLALEIARRCQEIGLLLDEDAFAGAVYYGEIADGGASHQFDLPDALEDIRRRWRMFYFHHFAAVSLEALFSWLVIALHDFGLGGTTLEVATGPLRSQAFSRSLSEALSVVVPECLGASSPRAFFAAQGIGSSRLDEGTSVKIDEAIRPGSGLCERRLEGLLRGGGFLQSPDALGVALILLATTLARFERWRAGNLGAWLATAAHDPYIDVVPPVLAEGLLRRFGDWWGASWGDLAQYVLSRYVIQQHRMMAYEKSATGHRCIVESDGMRFWATGDYGKIGMLNPRLRSALQILADLRLLEPVRGGGFVPTAEGLRFLEALLEEAADEVP